MAWFDDLNLPGSTVTGHFAFVREDGPDVDDAPDLQLASGKIRFEPTAKAVRAGGAWVGISPVTAVVFDGELVVAEEDPRPLRLLSTDADTGVAGWGWEAKFDIKGASIKPIRFHAPAAGVHLTGDDLIPITGLPVEVITGATGNSAYEVAVANGFTGTVEEWLESLKGDGSAWADITGKPTSFPSTVPDVQGLAARLAALEYDSGPRDLASTAPGMTSGGWIIQRVGPWVFSNLYDVALTATASTYWMQPGFLPVGFRPPATPTAPYINFDCTIRNANYTPGPLRIDRYGGVTIYGVTGKIIAVTAVWKTNDQIPTSLPGTPA